MTRVILDGLKKRSGAVDAVDGASLEIRSGELTCLVGPAGSGKTTLATLVAGLIAPDQGEIYFGDRMVNELSPIERGVSFVPADLGLWPALSVADNVAFPLEAKRIPRGERKRRAAEMLTGLRIDSLSGRRPGQLSPSQRVKAALARALVTEPRLLVLDEPLAGLEPRARDEFAPALKRILAEAGATTLLLTDDAAQALAMADVLAVIDLGRIVQSGAPRELYNRPVDVFVARLLGPTNLVQGQIEGNLSESAGEVVVRTPLGRLVGQARTPIPPAGSPVTISIRPDALSTSAAGPVNWNRFPATLERILFRGELCHVHARAKGDWPVIFAPLQSQAKDLREGQSATLAVAPENVVVLPGRFAVAGTP